MQFQSKRIQYRFDQLLTKCWMEQWSCSIRLLRYLLYRSQHKAERSPIDFNSLRALESSVFLPTVTSRGVTVWEVPNAFAKKRFAVGHNGWHSAETPECFTRYLLHVERYHLVPSLLRRSNYRALPSQACCDHAPFCILMRSPKDH